MSEGSSGEVKRTVMEEKSEQQQGRGSLEKVRSCKGYLYYSSTLKNKAKNPRCVGFPRTLRQGPDYVVVKSEAEASKEGRMVDFYYGCLGYSVYMTEKDSSAIAMKQPTKTRLPVCVGGLRILADETASSSNTSPVPARVQNRNDSRELSEGSSGEVKRTVMEEKSEQQQGRGSLEKGRSCKGFLYYSSTLKNKAKNPRCVGISRTLRQGNRTFSLFSRKLDLIDRWVAQFSELALMAAKVPESTTPRSSLVEFDYWLLPRP